MEGWIWYYFSSHRHYVDKVMEPAGRTGLVNAAVTVSLSRSAGDFSCASRVCHVSCPGMSCHVRYFMNNKIIALASCINISRLDYLHVRVSSQLSHPTNCDMTDISLLCLYHNHLQFEVFFLAHPLQITGSSEFLL